ncbi:DUF928 domain-containing protein [uncultured Nostoc sp.]|uniref:DUF928 domain-containing protein n=1 Tax=uncultured Nostoc sp. TaxID=340711 RepID=UPI0035C980DE
MQRVPLTSELESQSKTAKLKPYTAYAVNYIWQDTVTNLADIRRTNLASRVLGDNWANLLTAVGLSEFACAPLFCVMVWKNNCDTAKAVDKQKITQY